MSRARLAIFLLASLPVLALLLAAPAVLYARGGKAARPNPPAFPDHVVLVVLGGGVRAEDMLDADLMPTLAALGASGRVVTKVVSGAPDAYGGAARILTGRGDAIDGAAKTRPAWPTLCEHVRLGRDLPPEKVWFVSFEGEDRLHLAHSAHPQHGAVCAPSTTFGAGPFAQPMTSFLAVLGRPLPMEKEAWDQLRRLRLISRDAASVYLPRTVDAGLPRAERVERALLRELDRKALLNRGPNPRDEQAFRAALTVLEVHRPVLTVVLLGEAEQAAASYDSYRAVLQANDGGLRRLQAAVAADPVLSGRTTFVVVADRGRDEKPGPNGRLGAEDASRQRGLVVAVIHGPGLRRRPQFRGPRSIDDVAPTIAHLLGVEMPHATGAVWAGLLNER